MTQRMVAVLGSSLRRASSPKDWPVEMRLICVSSIFPEADSRKRVTETDPERMTKNLSPYCPAVINWGVVTFPEHVLPLSFENVLHQLAAGCVDGWAVHGVLLDQVLEELDVPRCSLEHLEIRLTALFWVRALEDLDDRLLPFRLKEEAVPGAFTPRWVSCWSPCAWRRSS